MKRRASTSNPNENKPLLALPPSPRTRSRKHSTRARSRSDEFDHRTKPNHGVGEVSNQTFLLESNLNPPSLIEGAPVYIGEQEYSFWNQFRDDLGWNVTAQDENVSSLVDDADVFVFLRVPLKLEKVLVFGFFSCLDTFLFMFTLFPLRVVGALISGFLSLLRFIRVLPGPRTFRRTHLYDLLRALIMAVTVWSLLQVHMSRVYHYIRGQTFIKLYVIFNMLEIFDKLMCYVGEEVNDALYVSTQRAPRGFLRVGIRTTFALMYSVLHSLLYFTRLITLNAAINSTNNALLTILISNNFVELKSSVFKRCAKENLLQISYSDIVERFELFTLLSLTAIQSTDSIWHFLEPTLYVVTCELVVDWIKHSFISKFNGIPASLYTDYLEILCNDVAPHPSGRRKGMQTKNRTGKLIDVDPTQVVVRRVGLGLMPLTCVVLRFMHMHVVEPLLPALQAALAASADNSLHLVWIGLSICLMFLNLVLVKLLLNNALKLFACSVLNDRHAEHQADHSTTIAQLSSVQRYTMRTSRIPM